MKIDFSQRRYWLLLLWVLLILTTSLNVGASSAKPGVVDWPQLGLTPVVGGFAAPVHITHAGDGSGRIFVVEKSGLIKIIRNGTVEPTPFLDIRTRVNSSCNECGLLSVAFPPDFASKKYFFVYYTGKGNPVDPPAGSNEPNPGDGNDSVIARYKVLNNPDQADAGSEERILLVNQPYQNHNGGQLAFGKDNHLYVALGDGGDGGDPLNAGQRLNTMLGKILRIAVGGTGSYTVPADNPFVNSTVPNVKKEIWSYGWRNPWRFSFDRTTGDMYVGDVGQSAREEVDFEPVGQGGRNYGWKIIEGNRCFPDGLSCDTTGLTAPLFDYDRDLGSSVTGGVIYRGESEVRMKGVYFFGDFSTGRIWGAKRESSTWEVTELLNTDHNIASFGEDEAGNVYLLHYGGTLYRLTDINPVNLKEKVYLPMIAR